MIGQMEDRNCNKCLWATRDGSCASWSCEYVDKQEAYNAWKEKNSPRIERLANILREVRGEK